MEFIEELKLLKEQLRFTEKIDVPEGIDNIVIAGMGGSGIAGKIFSEFYTKLPVYIADDYNIPDYVSKTTLLVGMSYSGNTEETISAVKQGIEKGAYVVTVGTGGEIKKYGKQHVQIPDMGIQPRSATGWMLMPLINGFGAVKKEDIEEAISVIEALDINNNECLEVANEIARGDHIPVIYGAAPFKTVAYRWKMQFNENAKVLAYPASFPELNHSDTMALAKTYRKDNLYFIVFGSRTDKISKRISVTARITDSKFRIIDPKGKSDFARMFHVFHYGDYVSYHLSAIRNVDPKDIALIEELKKNLK